MPCSGTKPWPAIPTWFTPEAAVTGPPEVEQRLVVLVRGLVPQDEELRRQEGEETDAQELPPGEGPAVEVAALLMDQVG